MYGKPFWIKTHRNKGFSKTQNTVIFRIDFNEGQTWIQLCNGKIDEKAKHLYTGVTNMRNSAWKKYRNTEITILPHTTVDSLLMICHI